MGYLVAAALLIVVGLIYKFKNLIFKAKDATLIKEDQALTSKAKTLKQEISDLKQKAKAPVQDLTPEQVEDFWKDSKK